MCVRVCVCVLHVTPEIAPEAEGTAALCRIIPLSCGFHEGEGEFQLFVSTANTFHSHAFLHLHPALFQRLVSERSFFADYLGPMYQ